MKVTDMTVTHGNHIWQSQTAVTTDMAVTE